MFKRFSLLFGRYSGRRKRINPSRTIVMSFAVIILVGAFLLMLPVSSASGNMTPFITALFTATSATCVTGLIIEETGLYFSMFGQLVILALIQIGGIGFVTILATAFLRARNRMNMRNRIVVAQSLSIAKMDDISIVARHVIGLTFTVEGIGALMLALRFIPQHGVLKSIWYGIFHSISAFCNAGFDIFGTKSSLCGYNNDPFVLIVIAMLIITGGLGFMVWEEIGERKPFKRMDTYSRFVISITTILLVGGTILFFMFECRNPETIGDMPLWQQILNSFFQSVTCRTAGFDSVGQSVLSEQSKFVSIILMLIGGASGSTAGGVKVATIGVVMLSVIASFRSRSSVTLWGRKIPERTVNNAAMLLTIWAILVIGATLLISTVDKLSFLDTFYEVTSAYGTAGLSVGVTGEASILSRLILIAYMFFGRVGIMTISVMFIARQSVEERIKYPETKMIIG